MAGHQYCTSCGKENPEGAQYCSHCGTALSNSFDKTSNRRIFRKKLWYSVIGGIVLLLVMASFYQLYPKWQTYRYKESVKPLYNTLDALLTEQKNLRPKNGQTAGSMEDIKRLDNSTKELKSRFLEIPAPTKESQDIKEKFIKVCDAETESLRMMTEYFVKDMTYKNAVDATNTPVLVGVGYQWNPIYKQYEESYRDWRPAGSQDAVDEARAQRNQLNAKLFVQQRLVAYYEAVLKESLFPDAATGASKAISLLDLQVPNIPEFEILSPMSIDEASTFLGKCTKVQYDWNDSWAGARAWFDGGEIWIEYARNTTDKGKVARLFITRPDFATQRGIKVGDSRQKVIEKYGEPKDTVKSKGVEYKNVTEWLHYVVKDEGNLRIRFGVDDSGKVSDISYTQTPW